ncbi:MAG TPA: hypothetical protein PLM07_05510 [Candidatus Rifleibacterium sp.]|nr:hypothetical protein [Candidatus Rifleibacterium sp.]HPT45339.1 hypothetical protein [Candidatus Rifleibacterium sp.]
MKKTSKSIYESLLKTLCIISGLMMVLSCAHAEEPWELSPPGGADIRQSVFARQEHLELHVPASFEGRTAIERRTTVGFEYNRLLRYAHTESDVELRGRSSIFDFEYAQDIFDVQVFRSKQIQPGASSCMDCHGGAIRRTTVAVGIEKQELDPKPYYRGYTRVGIDPAESFSWRGEVNHWLTPTLLLKGELKTGTLEQGRHSLDAKSVTVGLGGNALHRMTWSGDLNFSKVESYKQRKTFTGKVNYRLFHGLKLTVGGAAFLDGYTQYGTDMSEMGLITNGLAKDDPELLPSLFTRLKDDQFGYWHFGAEYEYKF